MEIKPGKKVNADTILKEAFSLGLEMSIHMQTEEDIDPTITVYGSPAQTIIDQLQAFIAAHDADASRNLEQQQEQARKARRAQLVSEIKAETAGATTVAKLRTLVEKLVEFLGIE
jgi:hypothetical protein